MQYKKQKGTKTETKLGTKQTNKKALKQKST